jgi:hypothetical protein
MLLRNRNLKSNQAEIKAVLDTFITHPTDFHKALQQPLLLLLLLSDC